jgi:hypothetical protein
MNRPPCILGQFCSFHNFVHGAEAEELREELEKLIEESDKKVRVRDLEKLLDRVDARVSVAYI